MRFSPFVSSCLIVGLVLSVTNSAQGSVTLASPVNTSSHNVSTHYNSRTDQYERRSSRSGLFKVNARIRYHIFWIFLLPVLCTFGVLSAGLYLAVCPRDQGTEELVIVTDGDQVRPCHWVGQSR